MPRFALSHIGAFALVASVLLVAFLVNRFAPRKRKSVRRMVIPLLLYFVSLGASVVLQRLGVEVAAKGVLAVSELLAVVTAINIAAILLFDLALPAAKIEIATLLTDIAIGLAYIAALIGGMRRYGVDLTGIIASTAVVTAILALSLQATLGNILGGVALQLDKSIRVGDWIQLENGRQGRVREIRWRHTVIETRDWDTLIVPNATLLSATIMILGKRENEPEQRRMWIHFNVDFRYSPVDVIQAVEKALRTSPIDGVAHDPPPQCVCLDFAKDGRDSFAYYALRYWLTDIARDDAVNSNVRVRLFAALRRARIPLAVPAAQLFVEQDDPERRQRKHKREIEKRIGALRDVEIFQPLTHAELAEMAESLSYAPFSTGETITKQGSVAHWLYILTQGAVEVRVERPGDDEAGGPNDRVVALLRAPSFFGEMGLMTGEPRSATIVAVTDVECYRLDREAFQKVVAERPAVASELSECLAERRVTLEAAMGEVPPGDRQKRVGMEQYRLLGSIRSFFGLGSGSDKSEKES
jgi:small-conductance mechanosensitive channel/CRP-like cAMP-binding protein